LNLILQNKKRLIAITTNPVKLVAVKSV